MNTLTCIGIFLSAFSIAFGGRPIQLSEADASCEAQVVLVANIKALEDVTEVDPFGNIEEVDPDTGSPFTKFAKINKYRLLVGEVPKSLKIYGGKFGTMVDFRIETGEWLLLLKKIGDGKYRAVDWNHGFMAVKEGLVEWPNAKQPDKKEWISINIALSRIQAHKEEKANKAEMATPRKPSD